MRRRFSGLVGLGRVGAGLKKCVDELAAVDVRNRFLFVTDNQDK
jgi:hypothetical protein